MLIKHALPNTKPHIGSKIGHIKRHILVARYSVLFLNTDSIKPKQL